LTLSPLLVVRAQTGDRDALNQLLTILQEPLYRHIVSVLGSENGADDVLQTTLLIIARKLGDVRDAVWARAWAYRIANREAVRAARRAKRQQSFAAVDFPEADVIPEVDVLLLRQLAAQVQGLPQACGTVVRMHYFDELTLAEVAEALELPLGTVKSRLAYGLTQLRRHLAD